MNRGLHIFKYPVFHFCARSFSGAAGCLNIVENDTNHKNFILEVIELLITSLGADVTVESANSSLKSMLDNGKVVDIFRFLTKLEESGVEPNVNTCQLLSIVYARQANPSAILNLLSIISDAGQKPSLEIVQNLAYAEASVINKKWNSLANETEAKQLAGVHRVANIYSEIFKNFQSYSPFSSVQIYLCSALAFAQAGNLNAVVAVLRHICDNAYRGQAHLLAENLYSYVNELYFILLNSDLDCDEVLSELKSYLNLIPARNGGDMLVNFSIEKSLPFVNSLIEKKNRKALLQINGLLRKKIKLVRQRTMDSPMGMVDTCLQILADNRMDDFQSFLKKRQKFSDENGEFFWLLLLKYFGTVEKLCDQLEQALIMYLKISQNEDFANTANFKRKLHRTTLLKFLLHAKVIDQKAEARNEKLNMLEKILKTIESYESVKVRKLYEARLENAIPHSTDNLKFN